MALFTAFAIYFLFWWITLFITLPFRIRTQAEAGEVTEGTVPSAPANPQLLKRLVINTLVSGAAFAVFWFVTVTLDFGIGDIPAIIQVD